jgi:hypothetical protein
MFRQVTLCVGVMVVYQRKKGKQASIHHGLTVDYSLFKNSPSIYS